MSSIETAIRVLRDEADAILSLIDKLDNNFESAVDLILHANGRVILTGMGKSGHIAKKVSATMASTGTPSFFLHPAEGIHGDLGMVTAEDVVVAYSNSGETGEIKHSAFAEKNRCEIDCCCWEHPFYAGGKCRCCIGCRCFTRG